MLTSEIDHPQHGAWFEVVVVFPELFECGLLVADLVIRDLIPAVPGLTVFPILTTRAQQVFVVNIQGHREKVVDLRVTLLADVLAREQVVLPCESEDPQPERALIIGLCLFGLSL